MWNSLPATIRQITSYGQFRQHLKHIYSGPRNRSALRLLIIVRYTNTLTYLLTFLEADQNLFRKVYIMQNACCTTRLLPSVSASSHSFSLRPPAHNSEFPGRLSHLVDCNFIARVLFYQSYRHLRGWLSSRAVIVLDLGAEGPGFKSQSRRCRVTVLGKLFTPIVPLFTPSSKIGSRPFKGCGGNCVPGGK